MTTANSETEDIKVLDLPHPSRVPMFEQAAGTNLLKAMLVDPKQRSQQGSDDFGEQPWPLDFCAASALSTASPHHETCINTKKDSIVGLGFRNEFDRQMLAFKQNPSAAFPTADPEELPRAYTLLSELVDGSLASLLADTCIDYCNTGNGYWEVVRDQSQKITAIWHIPAHQMRIWSESKGLIRRYFIYRPTAGAERKFCRFGDKEGFLQNAGIGAKPEDISEVIHFRMPNARSRYYGCPDWLSAVPSIELAQMVHQQQFDFFKNRGVPEFIALFLGSSIPKKVWGVIEESMRATIGSGNAHKSMALNLVDPNMKVQIEKLGLDSQGESSFSDLNSVLAAEIVSAHRVPPLLAGLHVPGKMGSTNELPNSLMAFQALYVDQQQLNFTETIAATVGKELGLTFHDLQFRKLTDRFDLNQMDTISRMRDQLASPQGQSRNPAEGLKKDAEADLKEIGQSLARLWLAVNSAKSAA